MYISWPSTRKNQTKRNKHRKHVACFRQMWRRVIVLLVVSVDISPST